MPTLVPLQPNVIATRSQTTVIPPLKTLKRLQPSGAIKSEAVTVVAGLRRDRYLPPLSLQLKSTIQVQLKQRVALKPQRIATVSVFKVEYFVNNAPISPPKGTLAIASLLSNGQPDSSQLLNGKRLIKGDLVPLFYVLDGQRLGGLTAEFHAKQRNVTGSPLTINKSQALQSYPTMDVDTAIERITGNFLINGADTNSFPDGELEFAYQFKVSDGMGRSYTIDHGTFTVYSVL